MSVEAPVALEFDFKSPVRISKTPVQKRLEQFSPKSKYDSPAKIEEKLSAAEQARQVCPIEFNQIRTRRAPSSAVLRAPGSPRGGSDTTCDDIQPLARPPSAKAMTMCC